VYSQATIRDNVIFLNNIAPLRPAAYSVIARMENVHPSHQLFGAAIAVRAMCDACGFDMRDLITMADNVMSDLDRADWEHIKAIRDYAANELPRNPR
jgi:enamine deaminase RidA (YjgF/YER057c/UK114 family)